MGEPYFVVIIHGTGAFPYIWERMEGMPRLFDSYVEAEVAIQQEIILFGKRTTIVMLQD